jgi:hypothetical protein
VLEPVLVGGDYSVMHFFAIMILRRKIDTTLESFNGLVFFFLLSGAPKTLIRTPRFFGKSLKLGSHEKKYASLLSMKDFHYRFDKRDKT